MRSIERDPVPVVPSVDFPVHPFQYFRIYDLRSTYATRLSGGGVANEWVTQLLRQGDAKVFKQYSQMKLQMKPGGAAEAEPAGQREQPGFGTHRPN